MANNENLAFLPDPGHGRKWTVDLNPKSRTQPMVIKLIERFRRGARGATSTIGFEYATADQKDLANKAQGILDRVGNYAKYVGEYDRDNPDQE